jgi:hypothetical protein
MDHLKSNGWLRYCECDDDDDNNNDSNTNAVEQNVNYSGGVVIPFPIAQGDFFFCNLS